MNKLGRLYSLDSRNQTEGAVAERFNNAASLRKELPGATPKKETRA